MGEATASPDGGALAVPRTVNVLYGSVTGNAEEIARRIHSELAAHGLVPGCLAPLNEHAQAGLTDSLATQQPAAPLPILVVVTSTTGEGDLPGNATLFPRFIRKGTQQDPAFLRGLRFALLGLGDSNWENFNNGGKRIEKTLKSAGAVQLCKRGAADDAVGLDQVVEPWITELWKVLRPFAAPGPLTTTMTVAKHVDTDKKTQDNSVHTNGPTLSNPTLVEQRDASQAAPLLKQDSILSTASVSPDAITQAVIDALAAELEGVPARLGDMLRLELVTDAPAEPVLCLSEAVRSDKVFSGSVSAAALLTEPEYADRRVYHIEVALGDDTPSYAPGDAIGLIVENRDEDVDMLLARVSLPERATAASLGMLKSCATGVTVAGPVPLRTLFKRLVDLQSPPKKTLLRALAEHCTSRDEARELLSLSAKAGRQAYTERLRAGGAAFNILTLLAEFLSCRPPAALLLDQLPPLPPRYYSASSASLADGKSFHFVFSVVQLSDTRRGLATGMLEDMCRAAMAGKAGVGAKLEFTIRPSGSFAPPADTSVPYIMIGPGTGVAPFRGFLRERQKRRSAASGASDSWAPCWLFFGCRHEKKDFLYSDELARMCANGTLDRLVTAFSRDTTEKVYVQHRMREYAAELGALLASSPRSRVYVCGDGGNMAAAVNDALADVLVAGGLAGSTTEALATLKQWGHDGRYLRDVWFWGEL